MTDRTSWDDSLGDLESLVQGAGNYVQPSEDLRPRVLETARTQRFERTALRRIMQATILLIVLFVSASSLILHSQWPASITVESPRNASVLREPTEPSQRRTDPNWETVEAFRNLRVRQARLFPPPL